MAEKQVLNPVVMPVRNGLHLTKKAIASLRSQDILGGVSILVINNNATDNTGPWTYTQPSLWTVMNRPPLSVAASWNQGLRWWFAKGAQHVLVVNNDIEVRPDAYRLLVEDGGPFVTCVGVSSESGLFPGGAPAGAKRPHPDFSCFLIHRSVYEAVGPFDEGYEIAFCEDCDYHVRMHRAGVAACCIDVPFLHHASQTLKLAPPAEAREIREAADRNRDRFQEKYGCRPGTPEYEGLFR